MINHKLKKKQQQQPKQKVSQPYDEFIVSVQLLVYFSPLVLRFFLLLAVKTVVIFLLPKIFTDSIRFSILLKCRIRNNRIKTHLCREKKTVHSTHTYRILRIPQFRLLELLSNFQAALKNTIHTRSLTEHMSAI